PGRKLCGGHLYLVNELSLPLRGRDVHQCASGSGRICSLNTRGCSLVPFSLWNTVRVPEVVHRPRPFQPAFGSSMRPSTFLVKKPSGYGTRRSTNLPSTIASSDSPPLVSAIGTSLPRPSVFSRSTQM